MRIPKTWVPVIAQKVVEGIITKELVKPLIPIDKLTADVEGLIMEELMIEDKLNEEIRDILRKHSPEIERSKLDYRKLFEMTKQKLVKERNLVL